jgi:hypothetical protein
MHGETVKFVKVNKLYTHELLLVYFSPSFYPGTKHIDLNAKSDLQRSSVLGM